MSDEPRRWRIYKYTSPSIGDGSGSPEFSVEQIDGPDTGPDPWSLPSKDGEREMPYVDVVEVTE